mmetsp:Transcript_120244/g.190408  ORF Transcript_120244/g.190408 Transcript_120244/m.190408 type:complete len:881 (+) Transcript_120244:56-2698(+)
MAGQGSDVQAQVVNVGGDVVVPANCAERVSKLESSVQALQIVSKEVTEALQHKAHTEHACKLESCIGELQAVSKGIAEALQQKADAQHVPSFNDIQGLAQSIEAKAVWANDRFRCMAEVVKQKVDADRVPTIAAFEDLTASVHRKAFTDEVPTLAQYEMMEKNMADKVGKEELDNKLNALFLTLSSEVASKFNALSELINTKANQEETASKNYLEDLVRKIEAAPGQEAFQALASLVETKATQLEDLKAEVHTKLDRNAVPSNQYFLALADAVEELKMVTRSAASQDELKALTSKFPSSCEFLELSDRVREMRILVETSPTQMAFDELAAVVDTKACAGKAASMEQLEALTAKLQLKVDADTVPNTAKFMALSEVVQEVKDEAFSAWAKAMECTTRLSTIPSQECVQSIVKEELHVVTEHSKTIELNLNTLKEHVDKQLAGIIVGMQCQSEKACKVDGLETAIEYLAGDIKLKLDQHKQSVLSENSTTQERIQSIVKEELHVVTERSKAIEGNLNMLKEHVEKRLEGIIVDMQCQSKTACKVDNLETAIEHLATDINLKLDQHKNSIRCENSKLVEMNLHGWSQNMNKKIEDLTIGMQTHLGNASKVDELETNLARLATDIDTKLNESKSLTRLELESKSNIARSMSDAALEEKLSKCAIATQLRQLTEQITQANSHYKLLESKFAKFSAVQDNSNGRIRDSGTPARRKQERLQSKEQITKTDLLGKVPTSHEENTVAKIQNICDVEKERNDADAPMTLDFSADEPSNLLKRARKNSRGAPSTPGGVSAPGTPGTPGFVRTAPAGRVPSTPCIPVQHAAVQAIPSTPCMGARLPGTPGFVSIAPPCRVPSTPVPRTPCMGAASAAQTPSYYGISKRKHSV